MTSWQLYWITRLDNLNIMFWMTAILALIIGGIFSYGAIINYTSSTDCPESETSKAERVVATVYCRIAAILETVMLCAGLLGALTPTTKEMAAIIIVPRVANNEKVQDVGNRLYDLAVEWMEELAPQKAKREGGAE